MEELNKHMDKIFREKLGDYRQEPPVEIWDGVKAGIADKSGKKALVLLWRAAAGIALIISAGGLYFYLNQNHSQNLAGDSAITPEHIENSSSSDEKINNSSGLLPEKRKPVSAMNISSEALSYSGNRLKTRTETSAKPSGLKIKLDKITDSTEENTSADIKSGTKIILGAAMLYHAKQDSIPRKTYLMQANWDMLKDNSIADDAVKNAYPGLILSAQVSPTYSYRDIGSNSSTDPSVFNESETGRLNYSGGLQIGVKTSERLSFHAGIMYARIGYTISGLESFSGGQLATTGDILSGVEKSGAGIEIKNSIGSLSAPSPANKLVGVNQASPKGKYEYADLSSPVIPTYTADGKVEQLFQYLEVPFLLRYRLIDQKFGMNLLGGLSTNILVANSAVLVTETQNTDLSTSGIRSFNYLGNLGLGFDYAITKDLLITLEPQFKYFLNSINADNLISSRPYTFGIFTGVRFVW